MRTKSDCWILLEIDNGYIVTSKILIHGYIQDIVYIQDIDKDSGGKRMSNILTGKWLCFTGHILLNT